ncbi:MAG TPA: 2-polyprenyl-3-methyl-6-methoxy-1,4-benzoquinone monooxygenase [Spongiibacteraceae bacterium]|nr:2-polyprenyl-3-methyl-6-methoxy-1,4-benzoquinone monooxygenase [Spongiibacteraceae bacterium]
MTRRLSLIDRALLQFDQALHTLIPGSVHADRPTPALRTSTPQLDTEEQRHSAGLMRINHTGEVCAQALYQGQALTAKASQVQDAMTQAAREEVDHLAWCEQRLKELNSRPSLLNPIFYGASYTLGAVTGILGDKISLGFVAATEEQVCKHLREHLSRLPAHDDADRAILEQMLIDEEKHGTVALESGGADFPQWLKRAMTGVSRVMPRSTYYI